MLTFLRRHLSVANLVAVAALVFAMAGGALAATNGNPAHSAAHKSKSSHYVITSLKQIKPGILKQLTGPQGPAGPAGPAGSTGATGLTGKEGAKGLTGNEGPKGLTGNEGPKGQPGEGVTVSPLTGGSEPEPTKECEGRGGSKFSNATATTFACNGTNGGGGGVLKKGETEAGTWGGVIAGHTEALKAYSAVLPISYPRPLETTEAAEVIKMGGSATENCPGSVSNPEAKEGHACLYVEYEEGTASKEPISIFPSRNSPYGFVVFLTQAKASEGFAMGTWAVTGG